MGGKVVMDISQKRDNAISQFDFRGKIIEKEAYGSGHINGTFCIICDEDGNKKRYILQKINDKIFKNTDELMENIVNITTYLKDIIEKNGGDSERETLTIVPTKNGKSYYNGGEDNCFRVYKFIENAKTYDLVTDKNYFYESGLSFGNFQNLLSGFDASKLHETIPKFHDTVDRFNNFKITLKNDKLGIAKTIQNEIEFILKREKDCSIVCDALSKREIPLRVTHNDTKLNNIMIDDKTKKGICVIDLDTVMFGTILNDYGDSIRFGASTGAEDEKDLSKIECSMELFDIYTRGFIEGIKGNITKRETELLPMGAKLMTLECGIRFLTDYLEGDVYFQTSRKGQNLDRARTQFKLVQDMEQKWEQMTEIIQKYS